MESLYILIPIAIGLVCIAVTVFIWAVKTDQFEDLERQGMNILLDDDEPTLEIKSESKCNVLKNTKNNQTEENNANG